MKKLVRGAFAALFWLLIWALAAGIVAKPLLLPGPIETVWTLIRLMGTSGFWLDALTTLLRVTSGYFCAVLAGTALGALCHFVKPADALLSPIRQIVQATPVSSFIILVLLWLKTDAVPAFISFLMVMPILWNGVQEGLANVDADLLEMAKAYRFSCKKMVRYLYAPSVLPYFSTACATGLGFAWKSGIAAEVIARPARAIGTNLQNAKVYLETPELFAWTALVVLLSMALEKALLLVVHGRRFKREKKA